MKMVLLDGGLFNQVAQYVFARNLAFQTQEPVLLDDSVFYLHESTATYQLGNFSNAMPTLLSQYFTSDVWEALMVERNNGSCMPQVLKNNGLEFFMICEKEETSFDGNTAFLPEHSFFPELLKTKGNVYYNGSFSHGGWFAKYMDMFQEELALPPLQGADDIALSNKISNCFSVCIHLCRDTYLKKSVSLPNSYYKEAIKKIKAAYSDKNIHFFVFTADVDWCKNNKTVLGFDSIEKKLTYSHTNSAQLMALCDVMVLSLNIDSYYAALLNSKSDKIVINPNPEKGVFL